MNHKNQNDFLIFIYFVISRVNEQFDQAVEKQRRQKKCDAIE